MSDKPKLNNKHPDLYEYDGGAAYFVKGLDFCCENPWDYVTNNGECPEYWDDFKTEYDAIEYFLEDRGFRKILDTIKELTELVQIMGGLAEYYGNIDNCDTLPKHGKILFYDDTEERDIGLHIPITIVGKRAREIQKNELFKKYYEVDRCVKH